MKPLRALVTASLVTMTMLAVGSSPAWGATPVLAGSVTDPVALSGALAVAVSGHYAYTAAYFAGELTAVDISNPSAPVIAGHSASAIGVEDADTVAISGGYAYVVSKNRNRSASSNDDGTGNSLTVFDIHTDPATPILVGQVHDPVALFGAYGVAIEGNYAYVAAQGCVSGQPCPHPAVGNDVAVIDVSNPANPHIVATVPDSASGALLHADALTAAGNYLYVTASYSDSLTIISVANPLAPAIVAQLRDARNLGFPDDVAVSGNDAYVADETAPSGGLAVVDVSNPASPHVTGLLSSPHLAAAYRVRVNGRFVYVAADRANTIAAVDVSDPRHPVLAAALSDAGHLYRTTGLDLAQGGRYVIASSPFLSSQASSVGVYPPFPLQAGGPTATGTISVIDTDPGPVGVSVSLPQSHGVYAKGVRLDASYTCAPFGLASMASCSGTVVAGTPIDTRTLGRHSFTITGVDQYGQTGRATVAYTVIPDPALTHLKQTASAWREHGRRSRGLPPVGTVFTFRLNESGVISLTFVRHLGPWRIVGGKCVAQTRRNRRGHRVCRRTAPVRGAVLALGRAGTNRIAFTGRIGRGLVLRRGTYTVTVTVSVGGASVHRSLVFRVE